MSLQLKDEKGNVVSSETVKDTSRFVASSTMNTNIDESPVYVATKSTPSSNTSSGVGIPIGKVIGWIVKLAILGAVIYVGLWAKKEYIDQTEIVNTEVSMLSEQALEAEFKYKTPFSPDTTWLQNLPTSKEGMPASVMVNAVPDEIAVLYQGNIVLGVSAKNRRYLFYGVGVGSTEAGLDKNLTMQYDYRYNNLGEKVGTGESGLFYYYSKTSKNMLIFTMDTKTNKISQATYLVDGSKIYNTLVKTEN